MHVITLDAGPRRLFSFELSDTKFFEPQVQGCLAHKKTPTPLGPPYEPRHGRTQGSYGVTFFDERGTPTGVPRS